MSSTFQFFLHRSNRVDSSQIEYVGEGGQLWLSHHTLATPSAGRGFGLDLAILAANPRREWHRPQRPQSPCSGQPRRSHWVLGGAPAHRALDPLIMTFDCQILTERGYSFTAIRLQQPPCGAAMSASFGGEHSPIIELAGLVFSLKNHRRFTEFSAGFAASAATAVLGVAWGVQDPEVVTSGKCLRSQRDA